MGSSWKSKYIGIDVLLQVRGFVETSACWLGIPVGFPNCCNGANASEAAMKIAINAMAKSTVGNFIMLGNVSTPPKLNCLLCIYDVNK